MENNKEIINVSGMSCGHCQAAVENALKSLPGVELAEVNLKSKNVTVTYKSEQISRDKIIKTIIEEGYEVM